MKRGEKGDLLFAKLEDLIRKADRLGLAAGDFLTPEEQAEAIGILNRMKKERPFIYTFEGGVNGAERVCPLLGAPGYEGAFSAEAAGIRLIEIKTKSGELPTHPAVLGSILALGIERRAVGDIFRHQNAMIVALKDTVAPYVEKQLFRVGKDTVELQRAILSEDFEIIHETEQMTVSVSSLRLDCIVASLCRLSREEALSFIASGMAAVNHKPTTKGDLKLPAECTLSLRGYGRFRLLCTAGTTKSGRLRLMVEKYI